MLSPLKNLMKETLRKFDICVTACSYLEKLEESSNLGWKSRNVIDLFLGFPDTQKAELLRILRHTKSQLGQDVFALLENGVKENGYFVEFGSTDGVFLSNSYLLENEFGWNGILAEPAKRWHADLKSNRNCHIETNCVWKESNASLIFNETDLGEISTIDSFSSSDLHGASRKHGNKYSVATITLADLLDKYSAPAIIDYLSIDTEGSEYEILEHFDFNRYQFRVITCEHSYESKREKIFSLLTENGYVRKFEGLSQWDDWYVKPGVA
jgi:FkbM family methyltransferase